MMENENFLLDMERLEDEKVIEELVRLKGIGRWTAEMFLIFSLNRMDVLPLGDLGIRKAISKFYFNGENAADGQMEMISEAWKPFRTVAVWYLWQALDSQSEGPLHKLSKK